VSVTGISGSTFLQAFNPAPPQNKTQQFQKEFQQLGQDLQSGNLAQAQSDFATLRQNAPAGSPLSASNSNNSSSPIAQAFQQLSQALQSGNLSAAQSDFATIQQDAQQQAGLKRRTGIITTIRSRRSPRNNQMPAGPGSAINQAFGQLGQALQSDNLPSAQQAYATLQQDFQQFAALGLAGSTSSGSSSATSGGLNISI